jgi:hypothetical protein
MERVIQQLEEETHRSHKFLHSRYFTVKFSVTYSFHAYVRNISICFELYSVSLTVYHVSHLCSLLIISETDSTDLI